MLIVHRVHDDDYHKSDFVSVVHSFTEKEKKSKIPALNKQENYHRYSMPFKTCSRFIYRKRYT
ncbi:hypothetical protein DERP_012045 [Dermatophagoides pteronyssinus]|uniref:Uncharacterized protein n=1 Tax=Dermatophagoides pteronyssinus TaxID=6956 RepID=A0ABQ8IVR6_DERPT|nr:hypothetical protein DERP_012045 [Dermatophagoides pteronyssinus]